MKRICSVCKQEKSLEDFYRSSVEKLGREYRCKECSKAKCKRYIEKDPEAWRKRSRDWREKKIAENPNFYREKYRHFEESNKRYSKKWRENNAEKHRAHSQVHWDKINGKIIKPEKCQLCLSEGKRLEAHHENYDKPKDIQWLCKKCHVIQDKKRKNSDHNSLSRIFSSDCV